MHVFKATFDLFSWILVYLKLNTSWVNFCMCPVQMDFILPRTDVGIADGGEVTHHPA